MGKVCEEMRDEVSAQFNKRELAQLDGGTLLENLVQAGVLEHGIIPPAAVLGNTFIFILAVFETSSRTLLTPCY